MRKVVFMAFLVLLGNFYVMAQSRPFIGYDKAPWGASVDDVKKIYGQNLVAVVDEEAPAYADMTQENVSDSIKERIFSFLNGKLYCVLVLYKDGSDSNHRTLSGLIEQRYGSYTDSYGNNGGGVGAFFTEEILVFGKFAPDILVELVKRTNVGIGKISTEVYVMYTWKKYQDENQSSQVEL